jgi:sugar O-acyltransferase (sialic acid O-acetyltransferase NeuD family)
MVERIQVLGNNKNIIPILLDLAQFPLKIFVNDGNYELPNTPIKEIKIDFAEAEELPIKFIKTIFGTFGPRNKNQIFQYYSNTCNISEDDFISLIHPMSSVSNQSYIESGCIIESMCSISVQSRIEFGVSIKRNCSIGHHCEIGRFSDLNPGVVVCGQSKIGKGSVIGAGAIIKDGIVIGDNVYIGMGSIVLNDIPANSIAYGNPCKVIRRNEIWKI